jgi:tetratricopeptide (TPR) repeat protein
MKLKFLTGCLLASFVSLPLDFVSQTKVLAVPQVIQVAQANSDYNQYMRLGYTETRRRNYTQALKYFQQALQLRPNNKYATAAIRNVNSYIQRRSTSRISFVPGRPGRLRMAASRGNCSLNGKAAVPLIATSKEAQLTTAKHPTFFFSIPETAKKVQGLEFVLRDDESIKPLYKETFKPVEQAGIVSITIPANRYSLKTGKEYTWAFSMICDARSRDQDLYLEGKIELLEDENLSEQIQQTNEPLEQAIIYTTAGFWENALSILANLRRQRPNDPEVEKYWTDLLNSVELEEEANQPLLPSLQTSR